LLIDANNRRLPHLSGICSFKAFQPFLLIVLNSLNVYRFGYQVMGDKHSSKQTGRKAGVNIIPGFDGLIEVGGTA
jgi:hypothetical protein